MSEFLGFVKKITTKQGKSKKPPYRPWTAYSAKLEKEDGTEYQEWLSFGFNPPPFQEGEYVKLQATQDQSGYWQVDKDSVKVAKNPPARAKTGGVGSASNGESGSVSHKGGVDWNSAVARAIELTALLHTIGVLPVSSAKGKAGDAKRFEEVLAVVDKLTVKLYNDNMSLRLLETVADTEVDTAADGALPDAEGEGGEADTAGGSDDDDF